MNIYVVFILLSGNIYMAHCRNIEFDYRDLP